MSCEFCKSFDFTSIAVKDNNIHRSGGSGRFTDASWRGLGFEMFNYCPLCGQDLSRRACLDTCNCNSTDTLADGTTFDRETIYKLREKTGVGIQMCKDAFNYAKQRDGNFNMMIAYIKAMSLASYVRPFDAKVDMFLRSMEDKNDENLG